MKIRTKFTLIVIVITVILAAALSIVNFISDVSQQKEYSQFTNSVISDFTKWNDSQSQKNLGPFAEKYIQLLAKDLGYDVRRVFTKCNKDYTSLKENQELRKALLDSTYLNDLQVGYVALIGGDNKIILSSQKSDEGADIRDLLKRSDFTFSETVNIFSGSETFNLYYQYIPDDSSSGSYSEYASVFKIPDTDMSIIYSLSLDDYMQPLKAELSTKREMESERILKVVDMTFEDDRKQATFFFIISFFVIYLFSIPIIMWFSKSITEPIRKLRDEVAKIGKGQFNVNLKEQGSEEIRDLIGSINFLGSELSAYTENLKAEVMRRQRMETEIEIAHRIQETTLPKIGPDFLFNGFELGVKLLPADKVAGDFYEFFYSRDRFVLGVGDVSGKGISAAFFMAITKALMHNTLLQMPEPDKVLAEVNRLLTLREHMSMFATVFVGFFNPNDSSFEFSNAGHENIFLVKEDGSIREVGQHEKAPVGFFSSTSYISESVKLEKNDLLIFYTDGVTEARARDKSFFGIDRFKDIIRNNLILKPQELCDLVVEQVAAFEGNVLYDDITIMIFKKT